MGYGVDFPMPAGFEGRRIEWLIPDPIGQGIGVFRVVRDLIETEVRNLLFDTAPVDDQ